MINHVMVYADDGYEHLIAVHFLSKDEKTPEHFIERAKAFFGDLEVRYCGIERLPISVDNFSESIIVVEEIDRQMTVKTTDIPKHVIDAIVNYRFSNLTIDIDNKNDVHDAISVVKNYTSVFNVYKTQRGFHIRAQLPRRLSFDEIIKVRREAKDDTFRINFDLRYHEKGLDFLTNLLFNEKTWKEGKEWHSYKEEKVDPNTIVVEKIRFVDEDLPTTTFRFENGTAEVIDGKKVVFKGVFNDKDIDVLMQKIMNSEEVKDRIKRQEIRKKLIDAYSVFNLHSFIAYSEIEVANDTVIIKVPEAFKDAIGRLIGKQGRVIKAVQEEIGMKVFIQSPSQTQKDLEDLKRKIRKLQTSLIGGEEI